MPDPDKVKLLFGPAGECASAIASSGLSGSQRKTDSRGRSGEPSRTYMPAATVH
jgi:hypothetical protein